MFSRAHPFISRIKERSLLTSFHSTRKTYHIVLDAPHSALSFKVGDSIGVLPMNNPDTVDQILTALKATGEESIPIPKTETFSTLREFLLHKVNLSKVKQSPSLSLLEFLKLEKKHHSLEELCQLLMPLLPRFYSIASSPKVFSDEIHLTVSHVSYIQNGEVRFGIGSHFLCDLANVEMTPIPIYVQSSNHFTLPEDPTVPIILIGPGTGVAPFRAFLQERLATKATGPNWLFFGERNRSSDFYYGDFWLQLEQEERLQLDLAFSRDQAEKIYVQHKMLEKRKKLWEWLKRGSYLYVCGDATEMAKDVERTLHQIVREEGKLTEEESRKYIKQMRLDKKYLLDVY